MGEPIEVEATPVYYHDCPALGNHTRLPRALMASEGGEYVLFYQHKCPFRSKTGGERVYSKGVTVNPDGSYNVDTSIAEKMR